MEKQTIQSKIRLSVQSIERGLVKTLKTELVDPPEDRGAVGNHLSDGGVAGWTMLAFLTNYGITSQDSFEKMKDLFLAKGRRLVDDGYSLRLEDVFDAPDCYQNNVLCIGVYRRAGNIEYYCFMTIIVVPNTGGGGNNSTIAVHMDQSEYPAPRGDWVTQPINNENGGHLVNLWYGDWGTSVRFKWFV